MKTTHISVFCCCNSKPIEYLSYSGLQLPNLNITHEENNDSSACHAFLKNEEFLPYKKPKCNIWLSAVAQYFTYASALTHFKMDEEEIC